MSSAAKQITEIPGTFRGFGWVCIESTFAEHYLKPNLHSKPGDNTDMYKIVSHKNRAAAAALVSVSVGASSSLA